MSIASRASSSHSTPPLDAKTSLGRENTLRTSTPPDPSNASANPRKMDDLDALGPINTALIRLRALWGDFPVVVRVHSGALEMPANRMVLISLRSVVIAS